jgi:hypothetical protein
MTTLQWHTKTEALALAFLRDVMTAAGIEHGHLDDTQLSTAVKKSSLPVWVLDKEGAKELVEDCNYYDFLLMEAS